LQRLTIEQTTSSSPSSSQRFDPGERTTDASADPPTAPGLPGEAAVKGAQNVKTELTEHADPELWLPADPDLRAVVTAWPTLPHAIRAGIVAMVNAAFGAGEAPGWARWPERRQTTV
jgi:hypothetical protein